VTNNTLDDIEPDIEGARVVWASRVDDWDYDILMHDGLQTLMISDPIGFNQRRPRLSGSRVVWSNQVNGWSVSVYDGGRVVELPKQGVYDHSPDIDGNDIVWHSGGDSRYDIYHFDGTVSTRLTTEDTNISPRISDGRVVWQHEALWRTSIMLYGNKRTGFIDNAVPQFRNEPSIDGQRIAWYGTTNSGFSPDDEWEIFLYDGILISQITDNSITDFMPEVSSELVAWFGLSEEPGAGHVFVFDGSETTRLAPLRRSWGRIAVDGSTIVWSDWDGTDFEIYMATPIPDPSSVSLAISALLTVLFTARFGRNRRTLPRCD
jgi:hypothetical protein